jgi:nicotinamide-nucleotide amidase
VGRVDGASSAAADAAGIAAAARSLFRALSERSLKIACAESCTGGLVTAALTDIPGSSAIVWGGVAAYSNECKSRLLGVPAATIESYGAVSREVAVAMAEGMLKASGETGGADLSLAITGIAGPDGGSAEKPVGLVWFAWRLRGGEGSEGSALFTGGRKAVREAAAKRALEGATALVEALEPSKGRY